MRVIILILAALAVLGGGGAGAYYYFGKTAEAASGHEQPASGHDAKKNEHFEFVELAPLILPILDGDHVYEVVSFVISVEVSDQSAAEKVERLAPRLADAYIQDLYGMLNRHAMRDGGAIEVHRIKQRLNELTVKVVGEGIVNDVLLQVVQQRPI